MHRTSLTSYKTYSVLILMAIALVITLLLRGGATRPAMVLGLVSLIFVAQLFMRAVRGGNARMVYAAVLVCVVIVAIIILAINNNSNEMWLATWYSLSVLCLMVDSSLRRIYGNSRGNDDERW